MPFYLRRTVQFVLRLCNPFVSLGYFHQYLGLVSELSRGRSTNIVVVGSSKSWSIRNLLVHFRPYSFTLTALNMGLLLKTLHFAYLWLGGTSSDRKQVLHFDQLSMLMFGWSGLNGMAIPTSLSIIYFNQRLFRSADTGLLRTLSSVLLEQDPNWPIKDPLPVELTSNDCRRLVRRVFLGTVRFQLSMICTLLALFVYTWVTFTVGFMQLFLPNHHHHYHLTYSVIVSFLVSQLSALAHLFYQLNLTHALALNFALTGALLTIFYVRMRDLNRVMVRKVHFHPSLFYRKYRLSYLRTIGFFFRCNHSYGRLFAAYLGTMCPANIGMTAWLLVPRSTTGTVQVVLYAWLGYLMYLSFVLHLVFAHCTRLIHRPPARQWLCLAVALMGSRTRGSKLGATTTDGGQLRLALDIQTWHVSTKYGFTYGVFGLVTMATFVRFVLLYIRFILIGYKLLRNSNAPQ